jgi:hypothetical protein
VYVNWHGSPKWAPGQNFLYHSPDVFKIPSREGISTIKETDGGHFGKSEDSEGEWEGESEEEEEEGGEREKEENQRSCEIKVWVRVEHLLWVLEPETLRSAAPQSSARHRDGEVFNQQVLLANYYKAQIDLFAEMVLDRSCNTIQALSEMLPYQLLVSCIANTKIPAIVRASYTRLLCRLWIDRFPHERIKVPKRLQVLQRIEDRQMLDGKGRPVRKDTHQNRADLINKAALPHFELHRDADPIMQSNAAGGFYKHRTAMKFHLIKEFVSDYFADCAGVQVYADKDKNCFTLELLNCLHRLVNFGFYDTQEEIKALIDPMVSTLDGRHDLERKPPMYEMANEGAEIGPLDASDIMELEDARDEVAKLRESLKKKIEESNLSLESNLHHRRNSMPNTMHHFGMSLKGELMSVVSGENNFNGVEREMLRKLHRSAAASSLERHPQRRYKLTNESVLVMEGKNAMLDNLMSVHKLEQDYILSKFMYAFKRSKVGVDDTQYLKGDSVRILKKGTQYDRIGEMIDPHWSASRLKVQVGGGIRSYEPSELQLEKPCYEKPIDTILPVGQSVIGEAIGSGKVVPVVDDDRLNKPTRMRVVLPIVPVLTNLTEGKLHLHPAFQKKMRSQIFEAPADKLLDLDYLSTAKLDALLLDLLMYESEPLFEGAMKLLLSRFTERKLLLKNMCNSMVLSKEQLAGVPTALELSRLRDHIESYEMWCVENDFSGFDDAVYDFVEQILRALQHCISGEGSQVVSHSKALKTIASRKGLNTLRKKAKMFTPKKKGHGKENCRWDSVDSSKNKNTSHNCQDLLRYSEVHHTLLSALRVDFKSYMNSRASSGNDSNPEDAERRRESAEKSAGRLQFIVKHAIKTLTSFVYKNPVNQAEIYRLLMVDDELLLKAGDEDYLRLGFADLVCELFRNNEELCQKADEKLYVIFAKQLQAAGMAASRAKLHVAAFIIQQNMRASLYLRVSAARLIQAHLRAKKKCAREQRRPIRTVAGHTHLSKSGMHGAGFRAAAEERHKNLPRFLAGAASWMFFDIVCCPNGTPIPENQKKTFKLLVRNVSLETDEEVRECIWRTVLTGNEAIAEIEFHVTLLNLLCVLLQGGNVSITGGLKPEFPYKDMLSMYRHADVQPGEAISEDNFADISGGRISSLQTKTFSERKQTHVVGGGNLTSSHKVKKSQRAAQVEVMHTDGPELEQWKLSIKVRTLYLRVLVMVYYNSTLSDPSIARIEETWKFLRSFVDPLNDYSTRLTALIAPMVEHGQSDKKQSSRGSRQLEKEQYEHLKMILSCVSSFYAKCVIVDRDLERDETRKLQLAVRKIAHECYRLKSSADETLNVLVIDCLKALGVDETEFPTLTTDKVSTKLASGALDSIVLMSQMKSHLVDSKSKMQLDFDCFVRTLARDPVFRHDIKLEYDRLLDVIEDVENMTDPNSSKFLGRMNKLLRSKEEWNEKEVTEYKDIINESRSNKVTFNMLVQRMVKAVSKRIKQEDQEIPRMVLGLLHAMVLRWVPKSIEEYTLELQHVLPLSSDYIETSGDGMFADINERNRHMVHAWVDGKIIEIKRIELARKKWKEVLDSAAVLFVMLLLTVVNISLNFVAMNSGDENNLSYQVVDHVMAFIFFTELTVRCWAYNNTRTFLSDVFNVVDVSVVGIDVVSYSVMLYQVCTTSSASKAGSLSFAKTLRLLRIMRVARLLRVGRLMAGLSGLKVFTAKDMRVKAVKVYRTKCTAFLKYGVARLVVDVITSSISTETLNEAVKLGVVLLRASTIEMQKAMMNCLLNNAGIDGFYANLHAELRKSTLDAVLRRKRKKKGGEKILGDRYDRRRAADMTAVEKMLEDTEHTHPEAPLLEVLAFLQLMMEGHNLTAQNMMREQEWNPKSYDLITAVVELLLAVTKNEQTVKQLDTEEMQLVAQCLEVLVEATQGPCPLTQELLTKSKVIHACKWILTTDMTNSRDSYSLGLPSILESRLKSLAITLVESVLEARSDASVHHRVREAFDPEVYRTMIVDKYRDILNFESALNDVNNGMLSIEVLFSDQIKAHKQDGIEKLESTLMLWRKFLPFLTVPLFMLTKLVRSICIKPKKPKPKYDAKTDKYDANVNEEVADTVQKSPTHETHRKHDMHNNALKRHSACAVHQMHLLQADFEGGLDFIKDTLASTEVEIRKYKLQLKHAVLERLKRHSQTNPVDKQVKRRAIQDAVRQELEEAKKWVLQQSFSLTIVRMRLASISPGFDELTHPSNMELNEEESAELKRTQRKHLMSRFKDQNKHLPVFMKEDEKEFEDDLEEKDAEKSDLIMETVRSKLAFSEAQRWLSKEVKPVEIWWHGRVELVYFICPAECDFLTATSKMQLKQQITIESQERKLNEFLSKALDLVDEMTYLHKLKDVKFYTFLNAYYYDLRIFAGVASVILNLTIIVSAASEWNHLKTEDGEYNPALDPFAREELHSIQTKIDDLGAVLSGTKNYSTPTGFAANPETQVVEEAIAYFLEPGGHSPSMFSDFFSMKAVILLLVISMLFMYVAMLAYAALSCAPLIAKRLMRESKEAKKNESKIHAGKLSAQTEYFNAKMGGNVLVFRPLGLVIALYILVGCILTLRDESLSWIAFYRSLSVFIVIYYFILQRQCWLVPTGGALSISYCVFYDTLRSSHVAVHTLQLILTTLAMLSGYAGYFYFAVALTIDLLSSSPRLVNVVRSVTENVMDLAVTFGLFLVVLYVFSSFGFQNFNSQFLMEGEDLEVLMCDTMLHCFMFFLSDGWRSGDIGSTMLATSPEEFGDIMYAQRVAYDVFFYIIVGVLLNNIVTGIILDTFGALREAQTDRDYRLRNECFISGITRQKYESLDLNFDALASQNEQATNHLWNYVFFLQYLHNKNKDSFNGAESYVWDKLEAKDFRWIPSDRCWAIQNDGNKDGKERRENDNVTRGDVQGVLTKVNSVDQRFGHLEAKFDDLSKKMEQVLNRLQSADGTSMEGTQ